MIGNRYKYVPIIVLSYRQQQLCSLHISRARRVVQPPPAVAVAAAVLRHFAVHEFWAGMIIKVLEMGGSEQVAEAATATAAAATAATAAAATAAAAAAAVVVEEEEEVMIGG